jgi:nucleoside 2-deoxyribosyltransferase
MALGTPDAIFLSGPISNALSDGRFDPTVRTALEEVAGGLERDGFRILSAHRAEAWGQEIPDTPEHVFRRDWHFAQACDAVVVVLPADRRGVLYRSDGVFIEIGWAVALGKPLFVVTDRTASGGSYLFDGLLALPASTRVFDSANGFDVAELSHALRQHLAPTRRAEAERLRATHACRSRVLHHRYAAPPSRRVVGWQRPHRSARARCAHGRRCRRRQMSARCRPTSNRRCADGSSRV